MEGSDDEFVDVGDQTFTYARFARVLSATMHFRFTAVCRRIR